MGVFLKRIPHKAWILHKWALGGFGGYYFADVISIMGWGHHGCFHDNISNLLVLWRNISRGRCLNVCSVKMVSSRSHRSTPVTGILSRCQAACVRRDLQWSCWLYKWQNNKQRVSRVTVTMASTVTDRDLNIKASFTFCDMMWHFNMNGHHMLGASQMCSVCVCVIQMEIDLTICLNNWLFHGIPVDCSVTMAFCTENNIRLWLWHVESRGRKMCVPLCVV